MLWILTILVGEPAHRIRIFRILMVIGVEGEAEEMFRTINNGIPTKKERYLFTKWTVRFLYTGTMPRVISKEWQSASLATRIAFDEFATAIYPSVVQNILSGLSHSKGN